MCIGFSGAINYEMDFKFSNLQYEIHDGFQQVEYVVEEL